MGAMARVPSKAMNSIVSPEAMTNRCKGAYSSH